MRYTVVLVPGERPGRYVAHVPAIPGCVTQGEGVEEAVAMARDAAAGMLAVMAARGDELPEEPFGTLVAEVDVPFPGEQGAAA
jgi:predicted RNase H-like HicB family nuclease